MTVKITGSRSMQVHISLMIWVWYFIKKLSICWHCTHECKLFSQCINKHLEHRLCTHNCSACVYIATSVRADKCHLLDLTSPTDCQYLKLNQLLYKVYTLHFVCKYCILQCTLSIECPPANCLFKNSHQPNCSCVMSIYLIDCLQNRVIDKHKTIQPLFHMWSL